MTEPDLLLHQPGPVFDVKVRNDVHSHLWWLKTTLLVGIGKFLVLLGQHRCLPLLPNELLHLVQSALYH